MSNNQPSLYKYFYKVIPLLADLKSVKITKISKQTNIHNNLERYFLKLVKASVVIRLET